MSRLPENTGVCFLIVRRRVPTCVCRYFSRKPWAWVYHLVLLGLGLTDCCLFLPSLFLMIYWLKPHNRTYFGCDQWLS